ncbi:hypothetical protein KC354_g142 [Hortaea werneckii]|nr:hypothetical protein KC354_g142 [Hortaea werneckii]
MASPTTTQRSLPQWIPSAHKRQRQRKRGSSACQAHEEDMNESSHSQAVTRGKPGQNSRIGDVKSVADDIEDRERLGKTDLGGELGQADKANDEDFSRQGDGVLGEDERLSAASVAERS